MVVFPPPRRLPAAGTRHKPNASASMRRPCLANRVRIPGGPRRRCSRAGGRAADCDALASPAIAP